MTDQTMEREIQELRRKIEDLEARKEHLLEEAAKKKLWHPLDDLKKYAGKILREIAVVNADENEDEPRIEILNIYDADIWLGVTDEGYLHVITMHSREYEDYDEEIFDTPLEEEDYDGYYAEETGTCLCGYLWIEE